jgi:hypothetical protein
VRASQPGRQSKVQNFTFIAGLSSVSTWAGAVMLTQFETFWDRFTEKAQGIRLKQPKIAIVYQIDMQAQSYADGTWPGKTIPQIRRVVSDFSLPDPHYEFE